MSEQKKPTGAPVKGGAPTQGGTRSTPAQPNQGTTTKDGRSTDHEQGREHKPNVDAGKKTPMTGQHSSLPGTPGKATDGAEKHRTDNTAGDAERMTAKHQDERKEATDKAKPAAGSTTTVKH
jgi:hypothetical protein